MLRLLPKCMKSSDKIVLLAVFTGEGIISYAANDIENQGRNTRD